MFAIKIDVLGNDSPAPLYEKYDGQLQPQPAFISFDTRQEVQPGGVIELEADFSGEIGNAVPANVFHGVVQRWTVPSAVSLSALESLAEDEKFIAMVKEILQNPPACLVGVSKQRHPWHP